MLDRRTNREHFLLIISVTLWFSCQIDLPGGGFIQKPRSELRPVSDEFDSAEVSMTHGGHWLLDERTNRVFLGRNNVSLWFSCKSYLLGGRFIQKPAPELRSVSDELATPEKVIPSGVENSSDTRLSLCASMLQHLNVDKFCT